MNAPADQAQAAGPEPSDFYSTAPALADLREISESASYAALPEDWHVLVADVRNSTQAALGGRYKEVNLVGVSVIAAVRNAVRPTEIPYVFGGDGATLCVPNSCLVQARLALEATREMARRQFSLDLRVGAVSILELRHMGHDVMVARHRLSDLVSQAVFFGSGLEAAEEMIKCDSGEAKEQAVSPEAASSADFEGLECRWKEVPSVHGETIALLVKPTAPNEKAALKTIREVLEYVDRIYGDWATSRPVQEEALQLAVSPRLLRHEHRVRSFGTGWLGRLRYAAGLGLGVLAGGVMMALGLQRSGVNWGDYRSDLVQTTDCRKYDGVLRLVLSGDAGQRIALRQALGELRDEGRCAFGIQASSAALVTCLIENRNGRHVHFVDGAGGGYSQAALEMKEQLRNGSQAMCKDKHPGAIESQWNLSAPQEHAQA